MTKGVGQYDLNKQKSGNKIAADFVHLLAQ